MMTETTNILALIEADHRRVEQLLEEMESADPNELYGCFNEIYTEMSLHAYGEELVFYPAMMEHEETKQYIEEAESEHNAVKILLEQMKQLEPRNEEFALKMKHLKDSVMHHVEEEESEIFAAVQQHMSEEQLMQLGQEFQAAKRRMTADVEESIAR